MLGLWFGVWLIVTAPLVVRLRVRKPDAHWTDWARLGLQSVLITIALMFLLIMWGVSHMH